LVAPNGILRFTARTACVAAMGQFRAAGRIVRASSSIAFRPSE
jgi:hypothetical protein